MAFFRLIPNLIIMAPKDFKEFEDMLEYVVKLKKPVVIRYPRGGEDSRITFSKHEKVSLGKAEVLRDGNDLSIIAIGKTVARAMDISNMLKKSGVNAEVINARFLKPLDNKTILKSINKTKHVITIEDGTIINGLGTTIKELIIDNKLKDIEIKSYAYPDKFIKHGEVDELEKIYKQDSKSICSDILHNIKIIKERNKNIKNG